ncbi:MAG TPA: Stp1/IreP family PP2C-type Ser/Thr phosphatase [Gemmatimonadales bacterium]|nr:Stp1/IreP family PP2C-type Ser/Thr phosphatase [Gemmatimonadales bacterium]
MHFSCAARTDVGVVRSGNEDSYLMLSDRGIFVVADGMGGHAAGEVASEMATRIIAREIGALRGVEDDEASRRVQRAIVTANESIYERTLAEHDKRGMGTTATVLVLMRGRYLIGQVGDSRAYILRDGEFLQLTKDHSYVQEQVDAGLLTPDQARVHPYSNVITRCVGAGSEVLPDIYFGALRAGDVLLLASDGLTGMLEDDQLVKILQSDGGPEAWVDRMVAEANYRGGLDNITAIVVRIDSLD